MLGVGGGAAIAAREHLAARLQRLRQHEPRVRDRRAERARRLRLEARALGEMTRYALNERCIGLLHDRGDFTRSLGEHLDLEAARRVRMAGEPADARAQSLAALERP